MPRPACALALVLALSAAARAQPVLPAEVHPSLLFTRTEVPQLAQRIRREPYATWWATVLARASSPPDSASEERTKARYAKAAAFAWWLTGDDAHARTAAGFLLDMAFPPDGGDLGEPHNEGEVVMQYAQAYDMLHPFLEGYPDSLATVRDKLAEEADRLFDGIVVHEIDLGFLGKIRIRLHETTDPRDLSVLHLDNWHIRAYGGLGLAAYALAGHAGSGGSRPQEWADRAWDLVTRSFAHQIEPVDGGYAEGPFYARYAADVYLPYLFALKARSGIDLFADPLVSRLHDWSLNLRLPNGRRPNTDDAQIDDFYGNYLAGVDADGPVHHWDWLTDEQGLFVRGFNEMDAIAFYDDRVPAMPPDWGPTAFMPEAGDAVFRSDWSAAATYLLLRGEHGRARAQGLGHEHADETSFILYAHHEMLAVDAGYINFANHDKVNAGRAHSLILVDGEGPPIDRISGQAVDGGEDAWIEDTFAHPGADYAEVRAAYQGATFRRRLLFAGREYFVVADEVAAPAAHAFQWRLHGNGGGTSGGTYARTGELARWTRDRAELLAYLPARPGRTFAEADTVHSFDYLEELTHTFLAVTQADSTARFLAVLFPRPRTGQEPVFETAASSGGQAVGLGRGDGARDLTWARDAGADSTVIDAVASDAVASDAAFGWLRVQGGAVARYSLQDGTHLRAGSTVLAAASDTVDLFLMVAADSVGGYVRGAAGGFDLVLGGIDSVASARFAGAPTAVARAGAGWQLRLAGAGNLRLTTVPVDTTVAIPARPADFSGDGVVDLTDFFQFVDAFGQPATGPTARFDLTGDGLIDFTDFFQFADAFGR